jgi:RNA polymerase sigma-70 factor (ECF subfamily)
LAIAEADARDLVLAHRAGDERAFAEIARLSYRPLYDHARRRLGDHHAAEDAVQETFVRAYRALPSFDGEFRLQAWLHRILANVCIDEGARRTREGDAAERSRSRGDVEAPDPLELTLELEACTKVREALAELPDSYREAVSLRHLDDLPYREVAAVLGVSEENARARASRGRAVLQRLLSQGVAGLLLVFPRLRRGQRTAGGSTEAVAGSSSVSAVEQVTQVASTGRANVLTNLSAQVTGHLSQVTPTVNRLAELSTSVGGAKSSTMATVVGTVAAMMVPAAYTALQPTPPSPQVQVSTSEVRPEAPSDTVITPTSSTSTPTTLSTDLVTAGMPSTSSSSTVPASTRPGRSNGSASGPTVTVAAPDGPAPSVPPAEAEPQPAPARYGGIASDQMTATVDGSDLQLSGPIGLATATEGGEPAAGLSGTLSGEVDLDRAETEGRSRLHATFDLVVGEQRYSLRLDGWLVEQPSDHGTVLTFSGTYRLSDAASLQLDATGPAAWTLDIPDQGATAGEQAASTLRITLGERPATSADATG